MTTYYNYSSITGEYLGSATADESPLEPGVYLKPAYSTWTAPPSVSANEVAIFDTGAGTWSVEDDYRDAVWYLKADGSLVVFSIGDAPNATTMTTIARPSALHIWDGVSDWEYDIDATKAFQKRVVNAAVELNLADAMAATGNSVLDLVIAVFANTDSVNYGVDPGATTNFYDGVILETSQTKADVDADWQGASGLIAQILGKIAARKKSCFDDIDAAATGAAILAVTYTPF